MESLTGQPVDLHQRMESFENRLARIEQQLNLASEVASPEVIPPPAQEDDLEFRIGQFWFARTGIVVLAIGIVFLLTLPYDVPAAFPSLAGYLLAGCILWISRLWRKSYTHLAGTLLGGGLVLIYFATLRLHFFSPDPAITSRPLEVVLLLLATGLTIVVAFRQSAPFIAALGMTMGAISALVAEEPAALFSILAIVAGVTVFMQRRKDWDIPAIYGIILVYFTHALWWIGNPFLGHPISLATGPHFSIFFVLLYVLLFGIGPLMTKTGGGERTASTIGMLLNALAGYTMFFLLTMSTAKDLPAVSHMAAAAVYLPLAIVFWTRQQSRYATFFYAIVGHGALSVAIIFASGHPDYFVWLSWQSVLVVATAIWFRSRFIVVANFLIYLLVFMVYLILAGSLGAISISFGVVALLSARIMNWQQQRLELRTDLMRNAYLGAAFVAFPYTLYHLVPTEYVSLSWMGVGVFYYVVSIVLHNQKYRWMALLTLSGTVLYVVIIGITMLAPVYRIVSFLVLGVLLLGVSLLYTRAKAKKKAG